MTLILKPIGMKQLKPHPWKDIAERYPEGAIVKGKVVSITDYGAFVELDSGVEGLRWWCLPRESGNPRNG